MLAGRYGMGAHGRVAGGGSGRKKAVGVQGHARHERDEPE